MINLSKVDVDDVILYILINNNEFIEDAIHNNIKSIFFNKEESSIIYEHIFSMYKEDSNRNIDVASLFEYIGRNYKEDIKKYNLATYINYINSLMVETKDFKYFLNILKDRHVKRIVKETIEKVYKKILNEKSSSDCLVYLDQILKLKDSVVTSLSDKGYDLMKLSDMLINDLEFYKDHPSRFSEFNTGIREIDSITNFEKGMLIILWSSTGMGKTTFSLNLAYWWSQNLKVIIFALEQKAIDIYKGFISMSCGLNRRVWRNQESIDLLNDKDFFYKIKDITTYRNIKIVDDPYISTEGIFLESRKYNADVVIIDNMNNMMVDSNFREQKYTELAIDLNAYAITTNTLVILIQQANANLQRPKSTHGLKYAKSTAEKASIVLGVYSPSDDLLYHSKRKDLLDKIVKEKNLNLNEVLYLYNCKGRYTGTNMSLLGYNKQTGRIYSLDK